MMNQIPKFMTKMRLQLMQTISQDLKQKNENFSQKFIQSGQLNRNQEVSSLQELTDEKGLSQVLPYQSVQVASFLSSNLLPSIKIEQNSKLQLDISAKVIVQQKKSAVKSQKKQIQEPQSLDKVLKFKTYTSLEQFTSEQLIETIRKEGLDAPDVLWVASQKIHGCNFSIQSNGQTVCYGRRNSFLTKEIPVSCKTPQTYFNQSFHDSRNLVQKFHNKLKDVFESIRQFEPDLLRFCVYGEYFGGSWPEDHPYKVEKPSKVILKGVHYTPYHEFYAFDIYIVTSKRSYWADVEDIPKMLKNYIPSIPIYAKGTFDEVIAVSSVINSTIPELLGLPKLSNNIIEGFVIRPNKDLSVQKNQRFVIKKKNPEFFEKAYEPKPGKKEKKEKEVNLQAALCMEELSKYINVNRINSAVSKYPDLKDEQKLKEIVVEDILVDANKDGLKLPVKDAHKKLMQEFNKLVLKEISEYFLKN